MSEDKTVENENADTVPENRPPKRAYKACLSCRKSKAKCELYPSSSSCTRCRREQRECIFPLQRSDKRRKVTLDLDSSQIELPADGSSKNGDSRLADEQYEQRDGITGSVSSNDPRAAASPVDGRQMSVHDLTPRQVDSSHLVVRSSDDAIGLLFSAAEEVDSEKEHGEGHDQSNRPGQFIGGSPFSTWSSNAVSPGKTKLCHASAENIAHWSQHRFVRQGWFSAREAITYIDLFFRNLSHLSPVADSYYADHKNHKRLILEEPLLCCTLLTISSRYHILPGLGGASRADFIHSRLWKHCEHLIQRITLGMEKYSIAKTRTLGSIKALLLLIEWNPRSLHFPPEVDGWDASLAPSIDDTYNMHDRSAEANHPWREEVFEPAKRSDRMSWTLLGLACTLALELGVFDTRDSDPSSPDVEDFRHIHRLVLLYSSQVSLRMGCTNLLDQNALQVHAPSLNSENTCLDKAQQERETILFKWIEITKLLKTTSQMFFTTTYRNGVKTNILTKNYMGLIEHFEPLLIAWRNEFKLLQFTTISEAARQILLIEYCYVELFVSSTAMQALVERLGDQNPTSITRNHDLLRVQHAQDFNFVDKVREASGHILTAAIRLADNDVLQFCPARLFLRIVTASILLLKSISLGSKDHDVNASLDILDRCIDALKTKKADEMHLSARFATLMARHARRFKRSLRVQAGIGGAVALQVPPLASTGAMPPPVLPNRNLNTTDQNGLNDDYNQGAFASYPTQLDNTQDSSLEAWLAQPFDPYFAPFGTDMAQPASGLNFDSLDFLWNLPDMA